MFFALSPHLCKIWVFRQGLDPEFLARISCVDGPWTSYSHALSNISTESDRNATRKKGPSSAKIRVLGQNFDHEFLALISRVDGRRTPRSDPLSNISTESARNANRKNALSPQVATCAKFEFSVKALILSYFNFFYQVIIALEGELHTFMETNRHMLWKNNVSKTLQI